MDRTLLKHERQITRLEDKLQVNLSALVARLETLEAAHKQAESDREQARLRELAELRARPQPIDAGQGRA